MFAASPFSTGLFKRFGHRAVTIVGVLLCSGGLLVSSFVPNPYFLFLTYSLLFGIGSNFIDNTSLNLVGAYFPRKNSARSTCFATLGWSVGKINFVFGMKPNRLYTNSEIIQLWNSDIMVNEYKTLCWIKPKQIMQIKHRIHIKYLFQLRKYMNKCSKYDVYAKYKLIRTRTIGVELC